MAGMATSGALTRWFRDHLAKELIQLEQATGANSYAALAEEAGCTPPGADGLVVLPYFSGERTPINDPQAKGVIFGLTLAHTRGHLYRAILEGVGYGISHHFEVLTEISLRVARGCWRGTRTRFGCKLSAIHRGRAGGPGGNHRSAYDAFLAGLGMWSFSSYRHIQEWLRIERVVKPDPERTAIYQQISGLPPAVSPNPGNNARTVNRSHF